MNMNVINKLDNLDEMNVFLEKQNLTKNHKTENIYKYIKSSNE